jgi:fumarate reductase subunit D
MKHLLLVLEPIIWLLFGAGLALGTILLTGFVLIVGLAIPMGLVPMEALDFDRAYSLGSSWVGRLVLLGLIVLPLWKGAHHVRSLALDFGGVERDGAVGGALYFAAATLSVLGVVAVIRL